MSESMGVKTGGANTVSSQPAATSSAAPAAAPAKADAQVRPETALRQATSFSADPVTTQIQSRVVARLVDQRATVYAPGLARVPLPARPEGVEKPVPKKPASEMKAARSLDGGRSPLAPISMHDARYMVDIIGQEPHSGAGSEDGEGATGGPISAAAEGAEQMPTRHGLVAYTRTPRGDVAYLTQDRWMHIRENHIDTAPQQRGKRTTTYWPTKYALTEPSMNEQQVIATIMKSICNGTLRNEVRDTRMSEYDLPKPDALKYGVSETKVSMAPDGLVLSAYPAAGHNVLAVRELSPEDQAELAQIQAAAYGQSRVEVADDGMFQTAGSQTTFG